MAETGAAAMDVEERAAGGADKEVEASNEAEADTSLAANRPRRAKKKPRMSDDLTPGVRSGGSRGAQGSGPDGRRRGGGPALRHCGQR